MNPSDLQHEIDSERANLSQPTDPALVRQAILAAEARQIGTSHRYISALTVAGAIGVVGISIFGVQHQISLVSRQYATVENQKAVIKNNKISVDQKNLSVQRRIFLKENHKIPIAQRNFLVSKSLPAKKSAPTFIQESDLLVLNQDGATGYVNRFGFLSPTRTEQLEQALAKVVRAGDDFLAPPVVQLAASSPDVAAAVLAQARQDQSAVDVRLQKRVSLAIKGMAFSDLCEQLSRETGITITAARGVADDKLTIFCKDRPVRDLMREITGVFGFTWDRTGLEGAWTYRISQPLRAQLLEEELRNKDRDEALLDLDRQLQGMKELMALSPEELLRKSEGAEGKERERLKQLATFGWGAMQMYFQLGSEEQSALRNGETLRFDAKTLPKNVKDGAARATSTNARARKEEDGSYSLLANAPQEELDKFGGTRPDQLPEFNPSVELQINRDELGHYTLDGGGGGALGGSSWSSTDSIATGQSPSAKSPDNATANAARAKEPAFQASTELPKRTQTKPITTADVLEALHNATGKDVIADYFTRLIEPGTALPSGKRSLFATLNTASDAARLRWDERHGWLAFRSVSFFNDRPKEVPARLLEAWKARHQQNNREALLANVLEIARLSDTQLDSSEMAAGAKALYGLEEWQLAKTQTLRSQWRFLASLPAGQRQQATTEAGIAFSALDPAAKGEFLQRLLGKQRAQETLLNPDKLLRLSTALLHVQFKPDADDLGEKAFFRYHFKVSDVGIAETVFRANGSTNSQVTGL